MGSVMKACAQLGALRPRMNAFQYISKVGNPNSVRLMAHVAIK